MRDVAERLLDMMEAIEPLKSTLPKVNRILSRMS